MANERRWLAVPAQLLLSDGGQYGQISVPSTVGIKVKQKVLLYSNLLPDKKEFEVKSVINETNIEVGPASAQMEDRANVSMYTVATSAALVVEKQLRPAILPDIYNRAVFEEEPTVAIRSFLVDHLGRKYDPANPFPSQILFTRDGNPQAVIEDTVTPANNRPLPVKLTGFDGDVKIEAENLNLETQLDGVYTGSNTVPDTVGDVAHQRSVGTDKTKLTQRVTAKRGTVDTDTVSKDVSIHDHRGNEFRESNPLTVSVSYEKILEVIGRSNWMDLAVYDKVVTVVSPDRTEINVKYFEDGSMIGEAFIDFTDIAWDFELFRYIVDDDGSQLLDDDDTPLLLD